MQTVLGTGCPSSRIAALNAGSAQGIIEPCFRVFDAVGAVLLVASAVRSTGSQAPLAISPGTDLALQLALEESGAFERYRVIVRTADGREIWRDDRLSLGQLASGPGLVVTLPSARLTDDDFAIRVAGITAGGDVEELSGYSFTLRIR